VQQHKTHNGYVLVRSNHPKSIKGYYYEHILVIENHIKRKLKPNETVHHINEIKNDNRIENLFLCSRQEHDKAHGMKTVSQYRLFSHWISKQCTKCHKNFYGPPHIIKNRKRCGVNCKPIRVDKTCGYCDTIFRVPLYSYDQWTFCSRLCKRKANNDKRLKVDDGKRCSFPTP